MASYAFSLAELEALVSYINCTLARDNDLDCLPVKPPQRLYQAQKNGVLLCKLLNRIRRGTVPCIKINKRVKNIQQALENQNLVIQGAQLIGVEVQNINAEDLWSGKESVVLDLLWKIIKVGLLSHVNVEEHPNLTILRKSSEEWSVFVKLPPEELIIRWVNHHLGHTNYRGPEMRDYDSSLKDSVIYSHLLNQLAPERCTLSPLDEEDLFIRAKKVLTVAEPIGCRKYLTPHELVKVYFFNSEGDQLPVGLIAQLVEHCSGIAEGNPRLNLAFMANLFHTLPGLHSTVTDMDTVRLQEELNTALSRCRFAEEERNVLLQVRKEMSDELKDVRRKLEESLREMEILKRKALRLEDENKHLTGCEEKLRLFKAENALLRSQLADMKGMESDSQATIQYQEITINSLKKEKEILEKEYAEEVNELENKLSATLRKQTTMVLQKEAITHERDLLKRKHDKCEAELSRLQTQVDRRQRHVQQLRQLFKYFTTDKRLAETLYGKLDASSLQNANGKSKVIKFFQNGGPSLEETAPQVFLLKDNFLFVFDSEKEEEPQDVLRLDHASVNKERSGVLQLKFTQREVSYYIIVSPTSQLRELQQELEVSADWWTERQRTSPCSRFKDVVQANMLTSSNSTRKLNLKSPSLITADV